MRTLISITAMISDYKIKMKSNETLKETHHEIINKIINKIYNKLSDEITADQKIVFSSRNKIITKKIISVLIVIILII